MQSDNLNELAAALAKAQGQIKAAVKASENPFFKSSYANLPSVVEACRQPLASNGIAVIQTMDYNENEQWLETMLVHSSGQWIKGRYPIRPLKPDPQSLGSAQTYARRYALMAMVGVVADDASEDDGEAASGRPGASVKPSEAPGDNRRQAATVWANQALEIVAGFKTERDLNVWHKANADIIARVRDQNEAGHKRLVDAIRAKSAQFSPLNAG